MAGILRIMVDIRLNQVIERINYFRIGKLRIEFWDQIPNHSWLILGNFNVHQN